MTLTLTSAFLLSKVLAAAMTNRKNNQSEVEMSRNDFFSISATYLSYTEEITFIWLCEIMFFIGLCSKIVFFSKQWLSWGNLRLKEQRPQHLAYPIKHLNFNCFTFTALTLLLLLNSLDTRNGYCISNGSIRIQCNTLIFFPHKSSMYFQLSCTFINWAKLDLFKHAWGMVVKHVTSHK